MRPVVSQHLQPRLVDDVQQVLGVDGERVSRGQHLLLVVLLQAGQHVLLRQTHLPDELRQVRVQQLLSHLDLTGQREQRQSATEALTGFLTKLKLCGLMFEH